MSPPKYVWTVTCECGWSYRNVVKSDVEQQARWHRQNLIHAVGADE